MAGKKKDDDRAVGKSNENKNLLLYVTALGALLIILVYVFVFQRLSAEADTINASNRVLNQRVNTLKIYYDNRNKYMEDTRLLEQLLDELLAEYPADAREEDAIMLAARMQQNGGADFLTINMRRGNVLHDIPAETVTAAASEKYNEAIQFCSMDAVYVNEVSYQGLKKMIQTILDSGNRIGIQNIVYSKGDADNPSLSGHVDLVFYSVLGTGREYVTPDITPYVAGTDNIFGEIVIPEKPDSSAEGEGDGENGAADQQEE